MVKTTTIPHKVNPKLSHISGDNFFFPPPNFDNEMTAWSKRCEIRTRELKETFERLHEVLGEVYTDFQKTEQKITTLENQKKRFEEEYKEKKERLETVKGKITDGLGEQRPPAINNEEQPTWNEQKIILEERINQLKTQVTETLPPLIQKAKEEYEGSLIQTSKDAIEKLNEKILEQKNLIEEGEKVLKRQKESNTFIDGDDLTIQNANQAEEELKKLNKEKWDLSISFISYQVAKKYQTSLKMDSNMLESSMDARCNLLLIAAIASRGKKWSIETGLSYDEDALLPGEEESNKTEIEIGNKKNIEKKQKKLNTSEELKLTLQMGKVYDENGKHILTIVNRSETNYSKIIIPKGKLSDAQKDAIVDIWTEARLNGDMKQIQLIPYREDTYQLALKAGFTDDQIIVQITKENENPYAIWPGTHQEEVTVREYLAGNLNSVQNSQRKEQTDEEREFINKQNALKTPSKVNTVKVGGMG